MPTTGGPVNEFLQAVSEARAAIETVAQQTRGLDGVVGVGGGADTGEAIANIKLAYRHLEDAKMRLGKVVQAYQGGRSVYDEAPKN